MTREYRVVDARRPEDVFVALRAALAEGGPAVVPRSGRQGGVAGASSASPGRGRSDAGRSVGGSADSEPVGSGPVGAGPVSGGRLGAGSWVAGQVVAGQADAGQADAGQADAGQADAGQADAGASDEWPGSGERAAQNVALVIETSGSTGVPKRVALSVDALLASAAASAGAIGGQGQWLLALPAHYVAGAQVLVRSLAAGTEPVYYGEGHFDPRQFAELTGELDGDQLYTSLVPVQLARIVEAAVGGAGDVGAALRRFDGILVGGQSLDPRLRERAEGLGARLLTTYGSSETAGGCVYDGLPIGTTVVRVVDGLLEISGPTLAEGYVGDEGRTAASFHEDEGIRWYRTGDLGDVVDGRVTVRGRSDNVIISGGEKVLLDAVERIVRVVPALGDVVVVAADDDEWGQVPVIVATGRGSLDAIRELVVRELGRPAAPARIVTVAELPRLSSGKTDRVSAARLARGAGTATSET